MLRTEQNAPQNSAQHGAASNTMDGGDPAIRRPPTGPRADPPRAPSFNYRRQQQQQSHNQQYSHPQPSKLQHHQPHHHNPDRWDHSRVTSKHELPTEPRSSRPSSKLTSSPQLTYSPSSARSFSDNTMPNSRSDVGSDHNTNVDLFSAANHNPNVTSTPNMFGDHNTNMKSEHQDNENENFMDVDPPLQHSASVNSADPPPSPTPTDDSPTIVVPSFFKSPSATALDHIKSEHSSRAGTPSISVPLPLRSTRSSTKRSSPGTPVPGITNGSTATTTPAPSKASTPQPTTTSGSGSATGNESKTAMKKSSHPPPQLIGDLAVAREAALQMFTELKANHYQYKTLGKSREMLESMMCDCTYEHGLDEPGKACGPNSDCINRLTQVECLPEDCRCKSYCKNQRFQLREYADIEIVQTEKKGFGLRAEKNLARDSFIYEYVGDVVNTPSFKKRMREYAEEGIKHFYFMMLQKDEFIDATKSGGIGRFANHSCNPNCYVAKWTVGTRVRMGIFAKRDVAKHEELTFNYNVDRYGHQAQPCYCGEPNCVGFIGGKTQTDIATMDDLELDALGITDEAELTELKGTKKKKGKKIDDPDFMPEMKPIVEKEVPKVVQAIRQTQNAKILSKLLTRIKITEDQAALRQIMRLRGYSLMHNVLEDHSEDLELITKALECMTTWPLLNKNKVEDSQVNVSVQKYVNLENDAIKSLAQKLLDHWETLPTYNRIPKRVITEAETEDVSNTSLVAPSLSHPSVPEDEPPSKRIRYEVAVPTLNIKPLGVMGTQFKPQMHHHQHAQQVLSQQDTGIKKAAAKNKSIQAIIAAAAAKAAAEEAEARAQAEAVALAAAAAAEQEAALALRAEEKKEGSSSHKHHKDKGGKSSSSKKSGGSTAMTPEEKEANKEKRLMKLIGGVVVKCMSKHSKEFDHDSFKKYAKELTEVIAEKEKRSQSYKDNKLDTLSDEKVVKIKKFSKEYITKILRKLEKSKRSQDKGTQQSGSKDARKRPSSTSSPSTASSHHERGRPNGATPTNLSTPNSDDRDVHGEADQDSTMKTLGFLTGDASDSDRDGEGDMERDDLTDDEGDYGNDRREESEDQSMGDVITSPPSLTVMAPARTRGGAMMEMMDVEETPIFTATAPAC